MSNKHETLTSLFNDVADSIRSKTGKSDSIAADNFPDEIDSIVLGTGNATAADVRLGKTFSNSQGSATGTMPDATASKTDATASASVSKNPTASATITTSGIVTSTTDTGYSMTGTANSASGTVTASVSASSASVTSGYSSGISTSTTAKSATSTEKTVTDSKTVYIQKAALGAGVSGNVTFTPSVTTNMATISKPSTGTEGTDYFSITGSGSKSGTVTGTASVATEGYAKGLTATGGSATGSIGSDAKKYIAKSAITNNTSGGSSVDTIPAGKQIKFGAGYNPSDIYYTSEPARGTEKGAATYYPSTSDQTISAGQYLTGTQTIKAVTMANISAANIKDGVTIKVGDSADDDRLKSVTGTFTNTGTQSSGQSVAAAGQILTGYSAWADGAEVKGSMANQGAKTQTLTTQGSSYTIPAGYHNGSGKVTASLTASTLDNTMISGETVEEATGDYGYKVTVAVPAGYHNAQSVTKTFSDLFPAPETPGTADKMLAGYELYDGSGKLVTGTMPNNGATGTTITTQGGTYTIPAGYTSGGTVKAQLGTTSLSAGAGSVSLTAGAGSVSSTSDNVTLTASDSAPTSGYFIKSQGSGTVSGTGSGTVSVGTGYITSGSKTSNTSTSSSKSSNTATKYYTISTQTKTATPSTSSQTISPDSGKLLSGVTVNAMPSGALSAGSGSASATGTNITLGTATTTKPSSGAYITATGSGSASVGTAGYLASGTSKTSNTATTYYPVSNAAFTNNTTLPSGSSSSGTINAGSYIKVGKGWNNADTYYKSADARGTDKAAATYNTSTSDQIIAAGYYLTGAQTIKAVTTSGISAANIKAGVAVKVGDANSAGRIANVTGTFTSDATAAAGELLSGKTAYVNGSKITGTATQATVSYDSSTQNLTVTGGLITVS